MRKVYIYGLGKGKKALDRCLCSEKVAITAYIDNYKSKETSSINNIPVINISELNLKTEKIIITLMDYEAVKNSLLEKGVPISQIICFYSFKEADIEENWEYIDVNKWRNELMWKHYSEVMIPAVRNMEYEIYADEMLRNHQVPQIVSAEKTVELVTEKKLCLARFGDNEFELILGRRRTDYQETNRLLSQRLTEVLNSQMENLLIAIADNYGSLSKYTSDAASAIRQYLGNGTREEHMQLLNRERVYYDAYLSRPYMIYRDKAGAGNRFANIRLLWEKKDVLVVEGRNTRFGVGNDLLNNARSVQRILTLDKNCFDVYDCLLERVKKQGKDKLILVILGPVATIMAYDLAKLNYWAVDIGQLDVEYEWYLRQVTKRCDIPYKTVSEVSKYEEVETDFTNEYMQKYQAEIIEYIEG